LESPYVCIAALVISTPLCCASQQNYRRPTETSCDLHAPSNPTDASPLFIRVGNGKVGALEENVPKSRDHKASRFQRQSGPRLLLLSRCSRAATRQLVSKSTITAAPLNRSCARSLRAWSASRNEYRCTVDLIPMAAAISRKSRPSCRVFAVTLRSVRS